MNLSFFKRLNQALPVASNGHTTMSTLSSYHDGEIHTSGQGQHEATTGATLKPSSSFQLRQRGSSSFQGKDTTESVLRSTAFRLFRGTDNVAEETAFSKRFLMGPHPFGSPLRLDDMMDDDPKRAVDYDCKIGRFRTRTQIVVHFLMEIHMLRRDVGTVGLGLTWQWVHSAFTNLAYYYHTQLTAAQRVPLQDVSFEMLPTLTGELWMASEYIVYSMVFVFVTAVLSILFVRYKAPHGRPLYCVPILRRICLTLIVCQTLRIVSFMCTTLPGSSRQCLYAIQSNATLAVLTSGPAPNDGNPERWDPPKTLSDILWRVDPTNGCGDLMFSSHTIFTMLFVCVIWKYFNWKTLKALMVICQVSFGIQFSWVVCCSSALMRRRN